MDSKETIDHFMLGVTETEEYKAIEYLVFSIRRGQYEKYVKCFSNRKTGFT